MQHHAFVIEAEAEEGIDAAKKWAEKELRVQIGGNPDTVVLRYGLFSVEEARRVSELAAGAPFAGKYKIVIIAANRVYHEAQNALLKIFEEPPQGTYLFLIIPLIGELLPTLRSRVQILRQNQKLTGMIYHTIDGRAAEEFLKANREKRSAIIKRLTSGKDEEERRALRDEAIAIVNGVEAVAYAGFKKGRGVREADAALLAEIATFRDYLHDRSAPIKMILEHLSLVIPQDLLH